MPKKSAAVKPGKGHKFVKESDVPSGVAYEKASGYKGQDANVKVPANTKAPTIGNPPDKSATGHMKTHKKK